MQLLQAALAMTYHLQQGRSFCGGDLSNDRARAHWILPLSESMYFDLGTEVLAALHFVPGVKTMHLAVLQAPILRPPSTNMYNCFTAT